MSKLQIVTNENYLSTKDASVEYGYSIRQLNRLCTKKKLIAFKHGNKWYLDKESLESYIKYRQ